MTVKRPPTCQMTHILKSLDCSYYVYILVIPVSLSIKGEQNLIQNSYRSIKLSERIQKKRKSEIWTSVILQLTLDVKVSISHQLICCADASAPQLFIWPFHKSPQHIPNKVTPSGIMCSIIYLFFSFFFFFSSFFPPFFQPEIRRGDALEINGHKHPDMKIITLCIVLSSYSWHLMSKSQSVRQIYWS